MQTQKSTLAIKPSIRLPETFETKILQRSPNNLAASPKNQIPAKSSCVYLVPTHCDATAPQNNNKLKGIHQILNQLHNLTGHDFSAYKKNILIRQIESRMSQCHLEDMKAYARYLKENPTEAHAFFKELQIKFGSFFKDAGAFVELESHILPKLCQEKPDDYVFRVWITGCATGEEAYSIAILLREQMDRLNKKFKIQIYGTDLNDEAINIARLGMYSYDIAEDVTQERLQRFFIKESSGYRLKKEIREMVVFADQDILKDPPFTKLDLLCCRGLMMMHLTPEMQNKLVRTFHDALKPHGILFLSPSEGIDQPAKLFSPLDRKWKFYRPNPTLIEGSSNLMPQGKTSLTREELQLANEKLIIINRELRTKIELMADILTAWCEIGSSINAANSTH